jgi:hypothetical protein
LSPERDGVFSRATVQLKIALTFFMSAITIQLDCAACAFATRAAILRAFRRGATARCVLAGFGFVVVGHDVPPSKLKF